ncbi:MAG: hypothetical protein ACRCV9_20570, partial [Burkholderiaceae bacterium]
MNQTLTCYLLNAVNSESLRTMRDVLKRSPQVTLRHCESRNFLWASLFGDPRALCMMSVDPDPCRVLEAVRLIRETAELNAVPIALTCQGAQFHKLKAAVDRLTGCYLVPDNMAAPDLVLALQHIMLRHHAKQVRAAQPRFASVPAASPAAVLFSPTMPL